MSARHLYVHVPFCARRCSYCDFAIAVRRDVPARAFAERIAGELTVRGLHADTPLATLYLGGGTPSRLGGEGVARLIEAITSRIGVALDAEITLEANPEDVSAPDVARWREAGVTRVSLGVQSFDPEVLRWMHRVHTAEAAREAVRVLRGEGIDELSLDLIYALPTGVSRNWERDLDAAVTIHPPHLSCYGLTIEPHTPLGRQAARGQLHAADDEVHEREFLRTHDVLTAAGYDHYEVSNYARAGHRAVHNSAYWTGAPYLGIGPSAHGFDGRVRRWNRPEFVAWDLAVARGEDPIAGQELLSREQHAIEAVYLGLRSDAGLVVEDQDTPMVESWCQTGWGAVREGRLRLTPTGWLRLDALVSALTGNRSRY
ncbi:MAG: radical SAM family heme chaperone HemW [Gemmatimonadaceae bacterium]|nr:radical SAM family heme chaperone HemW [Gemmatimonadaceae bacterium]